MHHPRSEKQKKKKKKQTLLHVLLTTYGWSSLSFSLLASACFFLSGSGRDGCLAPSDESAQEDLA
jgi:hypothetical protein